MIKVYRSGKDLILENKEVLASFNIDQSVINEISKITNFTRSSYAIAILNGDDVLFACHIQTGLLIFGNTDDTADLVDIIVSHNLSVNNVFAQESTGNSFFKNYNTLLGGSYSVEDTSASSLLTFTYTQGNIKTALLAGGCFWCIARPFYDINGVLSVVSGFAGGTNFAPTYEQTKAGKNNHRECILVKYDSNLVSYKEIVETYFKHVDPFDSEGQFIDRGQNYTCAIHVSNDEEVEVVNTVIKAVEKSFKKENKVVVLPNTFFFAADDEHQDYALKNPDKMIDELVASNRITAKEAKKMKKGKK